MAASRNRLPTDLAQRVGEFLAGRVGQAGRISVGLSGGCDSVVLLHTLVRCGLRERLDAIHVHHGLSPNADAWAEQCDEFCRELGIPLLVCRVRVEASSGDGIEAAARAARYAAFSQLAGEFLLLAHHRGDQAETVLFNLLRGTGLTGAAGIPAERCVNDRVLLRPLLNCSRQDIEGYAYSQGLCWINDESNEDTSFSRNFLRHSAMGALGERFPMAEASLARAAGHFAEALELLDQLALLDWQTVAGSGDSAEMRRIRVMPLARLKNLLRYRLRLLAWRTPSTVRLEEFARQLQTAGPDRHPELALPDGRMLVKAGCLHWLPRK